MQFFESECKVSLGNGKPLHKQFFNRVKCNVCLGNAKDFVREMKTFAKERKVS